MHKLHSSEMNDGSENMWRGSVYILSVPTFEPGTY